MAESLSLRLLKRLAEMARISLAKDETREFLRDLNKILGAFREIQKVSRIKFSYQKASGQQIKLSQLKLKRAKRCALAGELLERAPDKRGRYFRVPRVRRLE